MAAKKKLTECSDRDIEALENINEINELINKLEERKNQIAAELEDGCLADIEELLSSKGLDRSILSKLIPSSSSSTPSTDGRKKRADAGQPQPPYYRDPEDHSKTAGKKGRKPAWLVGLIEEIGKDACMIENQ